jgi:glycosyltransferase involved in cell wall biosynthesis
MVLFLHSRYRTAGGEERTVEDLLWVVREYLGEPAELLARGSGELPASIERARAAAGLLYGGLRPSEVAGAVRLSGARVLHAHNLLPTFGWRALAAARAAGARVVLHLHQYRLVCAVGVCFTAGAECTRCHARNTLPGVLLNCRGSRAEAFAYGASLALWQRRLVEQADAVIVPSEFARERLRELGAPLRWERVHVVAPPLRALADGAAGPPAASDGPYSSEGPSAASGAPSASDDPSPSEPGFPGEAGEGPFALVVSRLSPEKGVDVAIEACREVGMPLVIAGEGPQRAALLERARGQRVRFVGQADDAQLARLRAEAAVALVPSRSAESFGLAAAEALAAGLPVVGSRVGALPELLGEEALVPPGDAGALASAITRLAGDRGAAGRGLERVRALCAPRAVARSLADLYDGLT